MNFSRLAAVVFVLVFATVSQAQEARNIELFAWHPNGDDYHLILNEGDFSSPEFSGVYAFSGLLLTTDGDTAVDVAVSDGAIADAAACFTSGTSGSSAFLVGNGLSSLIVVTALPQGGGASEPVLAVSIEDLIGGGYFELFVTGDWIDLEDAVGDPFDLGDPVQSLAVGLLVMMGFADTGSCVLLGSESVSYNQCLGDARATCNGNASAIVPNCVEEFSWSADPNSCSFKCKANCPE